MPRSAQNPILAPTNNALFSSYVRIFKSPPHQKGTLPEWLRGKSRIELFDRPLDELTYRLCLRRFKSDGCRQILVSFLAFFWAHVFGTSIK